MMIAGIFSISLLMAFEAFPVSFESAWIVAALFESYQLSLDCNQSCRISTREQESLVWWRWERLWAKKLILWELWQVTRHKVHRWCNCRSYRGRNTTLGFPISWCDWKLSSRKYPQRSEKNRFRLQRKLFSKDYYLNSVVKYQDCCHDNA